MIYPKGQPADSGRSGGLTERDIEAKPPQKIPADVLRRLERSLGAARIPPDPKPPKKN